MRIEESELTVHNGEQVIANLKKAAQAGDCVIDFSNVKRIDSTALVAILAARRVLGAGQKLELLHTPAQLNSLIEAYGVQSLFQ